MLFIVFRAGKTGYALDSRQVIEIIPLVALRPCPGAPDYIAGMANYRGTGVPVVDVARLLEGAPCPARLGTRIVLAPYEGRAGRQRIIGLMAESVTKSVERPETDFNQANVSARGDSPLGKLAAEGSGFIQRVEVNRLLPRELEQMLFEPTGESAS